MSMMTGMQVKAYINSDGALVLTDRELTDADKAGMTELSMSQDITVRMPLDNAVVADVTILVGQLDVTLPMDQVRFIVGDHEVDHFGDESGSIAAVSRKFALIERKTLVEIDLVYLAGGFSIWAFDLDLYVETSRPQNRRIDQIFPIRGPDDDDVLERLDPVEF